MKKPKPPKKICKNRLHQFLGIVSPSLFYNYLWSGDKEVLEYAVKTGFAHPEKTSPSKRTDPEL